MAPELFRASAPGSLMLLGEHAVLHNKRAIVAAINKRISVTLIPRVDRKIILQSALGVFHTELDRLKIEEPFQFILGTLQYLHEFVGSKGKKIPSGFELVIDSEFTHTVGLGSSAAVTIATLLVLEQFIDFPMRNEERMQVAQNIIRSIQGAGSGADACASLYGGIVLFQQYAPFMLGKCEEVLPLICHYSGYKTKTAVVIQKVEQLYAKYPETLLQLFNAIEASMDRAWDALQSKEWVKVGEIMNIHQGIMDAIGVSDPNLNSMIAGLRAEKGVWGAKISGSGLGDCVVGVGEGHFTLNEQIIPIQVSIEGARYE